MQTVSAFTPAGTTQRIGCVCDFFSVLIGLTSGGARGPPRERQQRKPYSAVPSWRTD